MQSTKFYLWNGTCLSGCLILNSGSCVSNCPQDLNLQAFTYADNVSQSCVYVCPNNTYGYNLTLICISKCPDTYYSSTITQRC